MRHRHDRARIFLQMPFEPGDRLGVEMVGRLVEEQQVGFLQKGLAKGDTTPFAAGERGADWRRRAVAAWRPWRSSSCRSSSQALAASMASCTRPKSSRTFSIVSGSSGSASLVLNSSCRLRRARVEATASSMIAAHVLGFVEPRLLRNVADADAVGRPCRADEVFLLERHDPQ